MATENPMRIVDNNRSVKWASSRGTASFTSPVNSVATDELGLIHRGHNIQRDQSNIAPNRSGSAPPSMEGSYAAFGDLANQQQSSGLENFRSEEKLRCGPHLNPRFPAPTSSGPFYRPRSSLSTHEEEPDDDSSPKGPSDDVAESSGTVLGQNTLLFTGRHKSLVDLIQEDFPRTPSPVFSHTHSSSYVEEPLSHDIQNLSLDSEPIKDPSLSPGPLPTQKDELTSKDGSSTSVLLSDGIIVSDVSKNIQKVEDGQDKQQLGFDEQNELHQQNTYSHQIAGRNVPGYQSQGARMTSVEMQPILQAPGVPPPLYATAAAYMAPGNSFYPNFNASGLYTPPQYGGYTMGSSYVPPYLAGYPSQTGYPLQFNPDSGQRFSGGPTGETISKGSTMQNSERFYGHHGLTTHPTFPDPLSMQYFQQLVQDPYNVPMQYSRLPSPSIVGSQFDSFTLRGDQKFQFPPSGNLGIPSPRGLSSPTGLGFVPQFHTSPLGSPVMPGSPIGGAGRRYDVGFSQSSARNVGGSYPRWQGQRGTDCIHDHRKHTFLEELKATGAQRIDFSDIVGRIVEFSIDQHGSRFIQQKLENCSVEEKELVFREVLPHASKLMTDVFGNYVIQKFFEHGTYQQRKELASQLSGHMLPLSLQMYGCRVIQKALEVIELDQKRELVLEFDGHVMRCVRDQNGNHVIQKCIECLPTDKIDFIISAFRGQVAMLSTHPYGCRVIQRVLEHCSDDLRCQSIIDEILESSYDLAQNQYGNYVTQHVLERGKPLERSQIISKLSGKVVRMSQHKYASNVVEKCLEFGDTSERELLIEEILVQSEDNDSLLAMMKDQFANYVVQKILDISNDRHREILLNRVQIHLDALKKYTYGKHIVTRFEQLSGYGMVV
ncbi:hypothetical protein RD792_004754 [Penstemon davidsonii]|uniref:PUM-HD domain-containing protein n=1 Tax=Penstemon davidsonii TaxID=160366 RepID=A0ABR0DJL2_9LAMI|nr:hypothetical protein RD792_004754 [Penstemon davidsonii]